MLSILFKQRLRDRGAKAGKEAVVFLPALAMSLGVITGVGALCLGQSVDPTRLASDEPSVNGRLFILPVVGQ